jgi:hypothetical protein
MYEKSIKKFEQEEIDIFELVLLFDKGNDVKNKEDGIIYTPKYIADYIVGLVNPKKEDMVLEPSVGHGIFLFSLIDFMEKKYEMTATELKYWFESKVIASDINEKSIYELKLILNAFFKKKNIENIKYDNIFIADALFFDFKNIDIVIGNPPYIRTKNLDENYLKKLRENYKSCLTGNVDIYYAFIEKFSKISDKFSFIVPNSYITNNSAQKLRKIINGRIEKIIDFKEKLIFQNARTYTSIFLITRKTTDNLIYSNSINVSGTLISKKEMNNEKWIFNKEKRNSFISKEEMKELSVISGIATLRDKIFILKNPEEDEKHYKKNYNNKNYYIEKSICIDFFKLTKEKEKSFIIYPYKNKKVIPEEVLKDDYPNAYEFLSDCKKELNKRDKGKTEKYESWYAYGRKQGLNIKQNSNYLFIPIMTNKMLNTEIKKIEDKFLIASGFCIQSENYNLLLKISEEINSVRFFQFLEREGKPWPGKKVYYTLSANQLKDFISNEK